MIHAFHPGYIDLFSRGMMVLQPEWVKGIPLDEIRCQRGVEA